MKVIKAFLLLQFIILLYGCSASKEESITKIVNEPVIKVDPFLLFNQNFSQKRFPFQQKLTGKIDSISVDSVQKRITISFDEQFYENPFREENVSLLKNNLKDFFITDFPDYQIDIFVRRQPIEKLIPNYYRKEMPEDSSKLAVSPALLEYPVVKRLNSLSSPSKGLSGRNILLWHSHGWYYSNNSKRWEWQRPRLFQTVEDKLPLSFTIPYLIPMLENAGANVFVPRERDTQEQMVLLDNDMPAKGKTGTIEIKGRKNFWVTGTPGFRIPPDTVFDNSNPFTSGSYLSAKTDITETTYIDYIPDIPEAGYYSVSISYSHSKENCPSVSYVVFHSGGTDTFLVNQQVGGSTWIYLGKFKFEKGMNPALGKVRISNKSSLPGLRVTTDAVKFGGGMGYIARDSVLSNRPKYLEGARYWLQFAGMPDTLVYSLNKNINDYNDDYQSRAEYGNYLYGKPFGPNRMRNADGLGIPIHLSLAFHTDAGITNSDTVIGTLSIYSSTDWDSLEVFPNGVSRFVNRDLADILQTQLVEDISASFSTHWNRRQLRDARYSEAFRPNFPAVLLELLSHQNFSDIKFATDPRFKFVVSRSVYKAFLRFLSSHYGFEYTVQPLPVNNMKVEITDNLNFKISWKGVEDKLEPTAKPDYYILYTRIDSAGFDNGIRVDGTDYIFPSPVPGKIYSFRVTAVNAGGESFPSEILSAGLTKNSKKKVLVVNAFDRISGPEYFNSNDYSGFQNIVDEGVPDKYQLDYSGPQYDFAKPSKFITNDAPGHGASTAANETEIIAGNTFDFPYIHGEALMRNGISFISISDEAFTDTAFSLSEYGTIDIIGGEEKTTPGIGTNAKNESYFVLFDTALRNKITEYLNSGGKLFISGSHLGKELFGIPSDSTKRLFATNLLKLNNFSPNASSDGKVFSAMKDVFPPSLLFRFNTVNNKEIYRVESPDAFIPGKNAVPLLRYTENSFCAAYGYKGNYSIIVTGFPFETLLGNRPRVEFMKSVLNYLEF